MDAELKTLLEAVKQGTIKNVPAALTIIRDGYIASNNEGVALYNQITKAREKTKQALEELTQLLKTQDATCDELIEIMANNAQQIRQIEATLHNSM